MLTSHTFSSVDEIRVSDGIEGAPVVIGLRDNSWQHDCNIFLSYEAAIALSRQLRIAAGIDEAPSAPSEAA